MFSALPASRPLMTRLAGLGLPAAALALSLAAAPARALITNSGQIDLSGLNATQAADRVLDSELVLVAWNGDSPDTAPKVVFVKDLGKSMREFVGAGQAETGLQWSWWLGGAAADGGDQAWNNFLGTDLGGGATPDVSKLRWAVFGYASASQGFNPGTLWLYTTLVQQRSGDPTVITGLNQMDGNRLQNLAASVNAFLGNANNSAAQQASANGSGVYKSTDDTFAWGDASQNIGGATASGWTYNNQLPGSAANLVGQSSWFYAVTSADADFSDTPVAIDEFDNSTWDAYWGLAQASDGSGRYLLTYNLAASSSPTEQVNNILAGNSFAKLVGTLSLSSPSGRAEQTLTLMNAFLRGLASDGTLRAASADGLVQAMGVDGGAGVSPVPEPASALLALLGGGALALRARRRGTAR